MNFHQTKVSPIAVLTVTQLQDRVTSFTHWGWMEGRKNSTMEEWKDGKLEEFDNSTIWKFDNGRCLPRRHGGHKGSTKM